MTTEELAALLTRIQILDNRTIDQVTLDVWTPIIGHLTYEDALTAVNDHFRTSGDYLMPSHIVQGVRKINEARAQRITFNPLNRACVQGRAHHWDETSGWCHNGCGWRYDGQSEYNHRPDGHRAEVRDWAA